MHRSRWIAFVVFVLVTTGCWGQYRADSGHSGSQPFEFGLGVGNVAGLAEAFSGPVAAGITTAPSVADGIVFVTAADGRLLAFDAAGVGGCAGTPGVCAPRWTANVGTGALRTSPAIADGVVYVQGRDRLYAYDEHGVSNCAGTPVVCEPLWRSTSIGDVVASPTVVAGRVYTSGGSGLVVFDARGSGCSGSPVVCAPLWSGEHVSPTRDASPAVVDGHVYVTLDGALHVYDAAGVQGCVSAVCQPLWRAADADSAPAVVDGRVHVASHAGGLRVFDAAGVVDCSGSPLVCAPLWTTTLAPSASGSMDPPAVADGRVVVQVDGTVASFDGHGQIGCSGSPKVCSPLWRSATDGVIAADAAAGAPAVANGVVYVGGGRHLRAFDARGLTSCAGNPVTCDPVWVSAVLGGPGSAAILDGTVFFGTDSGLRAFRAAPGQPPAPTIDAIVPFVRAGETTKVSVFGSGLTADARVDTALAGATVGAAELRADGSLAAEVTVPADAPPGGALLRVVLPDGRHASGQLTVQSAAGAAIAERSGVSAFPGIMWQPAATRDRAISEIAATGAKWILLDLDWRALQQTPTDQDGWTRGAHDNGGFDAAVKAASARGLKVVGTIAYSPPWARDLTTCPDLGDSDVGHCLPAATHVQDYAAFAAAAAARYGSRATDPALRDTVTAWQLWNEPNHQEFSQPYPDPARYAAMVEAAGPAIKAADPAATVITGGTAPAADEVRNGHQIEYSPVTWLQALYANGAQGSFDAVGHHPYSFPWDPLAYNEAWNAYSITKVLHDVMAANGDGAKVVWGTEMGVATGQVACDPNNAASPCSMSDADQADWVRRYYTGWNSPGYHDYPSFTGGLVLKAIRDNSSDPFNLFDNLGLIRSDGTPKPSFAAYRDLMTYGVG